MMATVLGKAVITPEWVGKYKKVCRALKAGAIFFPLYTS